MEIFFTFLNDNKEWMFSGVGLTIMFVIWKIIKRFFGHKRKEQNTIISEDEYNEDVFDSIHWKWDLSQTHTGDIDLSECFTPYCKCGHELKPHQSLGAMNGEIVAASKVDYGALSCDGYECCLSYKTPVENILDHKGPNDYYQYLQRLEKKVDKRNNNGDYKKSKKRIKKYQKQKRKYI